MFKQLAIASVLGASVLAAPAFAGTGSTPPASFNVNITLTPKCEVFASGAATSTISDITMAYTAFQTSDQDSNTNFQVRCTDTMPYGVALSGTNGVSGSSGSFRDTNSDLVYTLNLGATSTPGGTNLALGTEVGNGNTGKTYYVAARFAKGQSGKTTDSSLGQQVNPHTITITY